MSLLDSLQFWKKKEPEGPPEWNALEQAPPKFDEAPPGMEVPSMPPMTQPLQMPNPPMMGSPVEPMAQNAGANRDIELILSRLDTIKVQLENLNTRMAHLERIAEGTQQPKW